MHFIELGKLDILEFLKQHQVDEIEAFFIDNQTIYTKEAKEFFGEKYSYAQLRMVVRHIRFKQLEEMTQVTFHTHTVPILVAPSQKTKNHKIVGHLPLGRNGKFAKTVFYFLRADEYGLCSVLVKGKPVNLGDGDGMQVPCTLNFSGQKKFIDILQKSLKCQKC